MSYRLIEWIPSEISFKRQLIDARPFIPVEYYTDPSGKRFKENIIINTDKLELTTSKMNYKEVA
jgi:hypothetical protein|tara:strand:+ start:401 stop:592 length:192 start_codon:yes stop_codon:yes gene_type:complete